MKYSSNKMPIQKNLMSEVKQTGIIYRAREFLNPQYFDCISIGPAVVLFSESSLMSIDYDDESADYEWGIKLPPPFPWKQSLWLKKHTPSRAAGMWPKTVTRLGSWNHNIQNIKQILWSDPVYEKDQSVSVLFVLDTNFQLSLYDNQLVLIHDFTTNYVIPPISTKKDESTQYINNIQKASILCFAFTKSFGKDDSSRNIILALGGRSKTLQMFQLSFSSTEKVPTVIDLKRMDLKETGLDDKHKKGKI
jgi:hypothetical protein